MDALLRVDSAWIGLPDGGSCGSFTWAVRRNPQFRLSKALCFFLVVKPSGWERRMG